MQFSYFKFFFDIRGSDERSERSNERGSGKAWEPRIINMANSKVRPRDSLSLLPTTGPGFYPRVEQDQLTLSPHQWVNK
ncbi:hypothetical protein TNCV_3187321 [Trichonephila clavipes]|nr:hypothetical protein TNCV_3187321 [Trichonephila clavipes]